MRPRIVALLAALAAAPASASVARPEACGPDRWVVRGGVPLVAGLGTPALQILALDGTGVSVEGACGPRPVRRRATRKGTVLTARWRRCGPRLSVVLRAVVPRGIGCEAMQGTIRARGVAPVPFEAVRSRCGDGFVDPAHGERCEAAAHCAAGLVCLACQCVPPVVPPTSSTTTTTWVPGRSSVCGNTVREPGERCDGADLGGFVCPEGGVATCLPDCRAVDRRECFRCGNGLKEGDEECDLPDVGGAVCDRPGESGGFVGCTLGGKAAGGCRWDRSTCWRCGNGLLELGEDCDDGNLTSGDGCSGSCTTECGDGILQTVFEECDDGNRVDGDGCASFCLVEDAWAGGTAGDTTDVDACLLEWAVWGVSPGPTVSCADGGACDRDAAMDGMCRFLAWACANVAQSPDGGPVPCRPTDVASVSLGPSAMLDGGQRAAVLGALSRLLESDGGSVTRVGTTLTVVPPYAPPGRCGQLDLTVAVGATAVVSVVGIDSGGRVDADGVDFVCTP
jgi:cysteine-rich repeat protein